MIGKRQPRRFDKSPSLCYAKASMKEYFSRYPIVKDIVAVAIFAIFVAVGTIFVNAFLFRSYTVQGPSMEPTFHTDDRVLVNRLAVTIDQLQNKRFKPQRGQVIVFRNPRYDSVNDRVEYIVKRVIAFEGERVTVKDGVLTVYNAEHPEGFHPDETFPDKPGSPSSGNSDVTVGKDMIYVAGDHRQDNYSYDSRNGLGQVPLFDVMGPVFLRILPLTSVRGF